MFFLSKFAAPVRQNVPYALVGHMHCKSRLNDNYTNRFYSVDVGVKMGPK